MKIKTINDVIPYLDMFYFMADWDRTKTPTLDRNGKKFKEILFVADERMFRKPEKILAKMMVSHFMNEIHNMNWLYEYETKEKTQWTIEWRSRPDYEESVESFYARSYARYSIYQRPASETYPARR
mgnify:CR=1 FL=1